MMVVWLLGQVSKQSSGLKALSVLHGGISDSPSSWSSFQARRGGIISWAARERAHRVKEVRSTLRNQKPSLRG